MRKKFLALTVLAFISGGALLAFITLFGEPIQHSPLAETAPLKAPSRVSTVFVPVAIAKKAIRDAIEPNAPRNLAGKREYQFNELLGNANVDWNVERGPFAIDGRAELMTIKSKINGQMRVTGRTGEQISQVGHLIGANFGRVVDNFAGKSFDQKLDINGNVTIIAKPILRPNWRLEPNLAAKIALADRNVEISGFKFDVLQEIKPYLDRIVDREMAKLQVQLRNDPMLEKTIRQQWTKMCRSISLGSAGPNLPPLWIEVKPTRAIASQPRINSNWIILALGVHAETRVVSNKTQPVCPFPNKLELVPSTDKSKIEIAIPVDLPFTELSRLLNAQLRGKTFPEQADAPVRVTVHKATIAASGDRLMIRLNVEAKEQESSLGLSADADVFVWAKPVLDRKFQLLRLTNLTLDVESKSVFGLAGAAARAAIPYVQKALEEKAVIDLKPIATAARKSIEATIADFQKQADGMNVKAKVTDIRLAAIEFDAKTLRVTAEARGKATVMLTKLP